VRKSTLVILGSLLAYYGGCVAFLLIAPQRFFESVLLGIGAQLVVIGAVAAINRVWLTGHLALARGVLFFAIAGMYIFMITVRLPSPWTLPGFGSLSGISVGVGMALRAREDDKARVSSLTLAYLIPCGWFLISRCVVPERMHVSAAIAICLLAMIAIARWRMKGNRPMGQP
jgi:hypothetical protein